MNANHSRIVPARHSDILKAADTAAMAIPPAFPLDATVAVNPFLGLAGDDLATAAARLKRVAGVRPMQSRASYALALGDGRITDGDLAEALEASTHPAKPGGVAALKSLAQSGEDEDRPAALPTIAELAATATGTDWPSVIERTIGLWAAGHFDRGQALWSPAPGHDAYAAWREWAIHDLTPEIAGLAGFCAHVARAPDTAERAILRAAEGIGLTGDAAETAFHRLFMDLGGWAQHGRWLSWQAGQEGGSDPTLTGLLAIRLIWEEALLAHVPAIAGDWALTMAAHAEPVRPAAVDLALAILQDAAERGYQRRLCHALQGGSGSGERPFLQAAFCIDVRSEVFRRALESIDPSIMTTGFAGFFGLPISHKAMGSDVAEAHLPVLLSPSIETVSHCEPACEHKVRIGARTARAWGRFRQAAVSSFAFVEAAGPFYAAKLLKDALGRAGTGKKAKAEPAPRLVGKLSTEAKADTAAAVLKAMSLRKGFARFVLLIGHGGRTTNNPHASAYHCGACGGHTGEVSARVLAALLNDQDVRASLGRRGIAIPADTLFVAGLHDTTTDTVTLHPDHAGHERNGDLRTIARWLDKAGRLARAERASKLPGATPRTVAARAHDWAQVRPEWGLAGCAAFIAAPRQATAGLDLGGRAFLHSYEWQDDQGFGTLELIMTAPTVVASWISLQYYGSAVAPGVFGSGNKLIHNVVGGIGVIEGNGGTMRTGLPWQTIHDGERLVHEPLRLSVMIEAPREAITDVLERHPEVRALFDNGWLHLFALRDGKMDARYRPGLRWTVETPASLAA